jgi:hypothetical protein
MKNFMALVLINIFVSTSALAVQSPLCSSSEVRLSLKPVFCIDDNLDLGDFDIPEVGLDLDDLQSIFDGAESSGGHGISPMNQPAPTSRRRLLVDGVINCQLKLLTDGGKRVSFLSFLNLELTSHKPVAFLGGLDWSHGLTTSGINWVGIDTAPSVGIPNYSLEAYSQGEEISLSLCQSTGRNGTCVEGVFDQVSGESSIRLSKLVESPYIFRDLKVSCQIH